MIVEELALGIEIGGTKLQVGLGKRNGELLLLQQGKVPENANAITILEWLTQTIHTLLSEAAEMELPPPVALGIGFGGPVDATNGIALVSHQVPGWEQFPLKSWFAERFPEIRICIENDSNASGWAEYCLGTGKGTRNFCYMNIGSGIGGALVLNGRLHNGQGMGAAEIGHTWIPDENAKKPGAMIHLEDSCSGWAIEKLARAMDVTPSSILHGLSEGNQNNITCAMLAEAARAGDFQANEVIESTARRIAIALSNVVTLVHPECIAIGGGVAHWGVLLTEPLTHYLNEFVFTPFKNTFTVQCCALQDKVVVTGAILLALQLVEKNSKTATINP